MTEGAPHAPARPQPRTLTPAEEMRLFAGLAVQPFLAAGVAFVSFPFVMLDSTGRTPGGGFPANPTDAAMSVALGVAIAALFITIVGVFPTALWVLKRRSLTLTQSLLFGLGFGNLPVVLGTVLSGGTGSAGLTRAHVFASLIGVTGAAVFWVISIRKGNVRADSAAAQAPRSAGS